MSLAIAGRELTRVGLIDDNPAVRNGYKYAVEDLHLEPMEMAGPLHNIEDLIGKLDASRDAVISDFQLMSSNYSPFNGDELVESLYRRQIPAVLCTKYAEPLPEPIRSRRRYIPVVLKSDQLDSDSVVKAFEVCTREFAGEFLPSRRPWRAVVRVEGAELIGRNLLRLNFVLPGWDLQTAFSLEVAFHANNVALTALVKSAGQAETPTVYAWANLGAERSEDVYVSDWSLEY